MGQPSRIDPDIAADFAGNGATTPFASASIHPDIAADFAPDLTLKLTNGYSSQGAGGDLLGAAEIAGNTVLQIPRQVAHAGVDLFRRVTGGDTNAPDPEFIDKYLNPQLGEAGRNLIHDTALTPAAQALSKADKAGDTAILKFSPTLHSGLHTAGAVANDVLALAPVAGAAARIPEVIGGVADSIAARGARSRGAPAPPVSAMSAEEVARELNARQSIGAAADGGGSISTLSPETQAEFVAAARQGPVNQTALYRHGLAESLPLPEGTEHLRLRAGQATGKGQQISDEKNLRADADTHGILSHSIVDQDQKLVASIGEIQRRATPDIVQRNNAEHGQAAIDVIKQADNDRVLDIRAKYKALEQANGGSIPIDPGAFVAHVDDQLAAKYLTKTAAQTPEVSEILDSMRSRVPMDFESFEAARTRLAEAQRRGGSAATAAGIVRDALEKMPLPPEAANLKGLADTARQAAKSRFEITDQNPAYRAAINDNVPKDAAHLHVIGEPSPLANTFMDQFFLGNAKSASGAYIDRLKEVIPEQDFHRAIEAAALNKLRDAAGVDALGGGSFTSARYRNARNAMDAKARSILSPQSAAHTDQLREVAGFVNDEPKDASTNRSSTALTLQRFGAPVASSPTLLKELTGLTGDLALNHLAPGASVLKNLGQSIITKSQEAKAIAAIKDAKLKFAIDATKPGAGLTHPEATRPPTRASP